MPGQPTIVDALGPWPWRVPVIVALAVGAMTLLMGPWEVARRVRASDSLSREGPMPNSQ
jgi:hypothetical protein